MKIKDVIIMILAAYLGLLGTVLVAFKTQRFFAVELLITVLLIATAVIGIGMGYRKSSRAGSYMTVFFSVLLLNTIVLRFITPVDFSMFVIMLFGGLAGLAVSFNSIDCSPRVKKEVTMSLDQTKEIPNLVPEIFDTPSEKVAVEKTVEEKKVTKKAVKKTTKKKIVKKAAKKTAKKTAKKAGRVTKK